MIALRYFPLAGLVLGFFSACVPHSSEEHPDYAGPDRGFIDSTLIDSAGPGASLVGINARIAQTTTVLDTAGSALAKEEELLEAKLKEKETELETGKKVASKLPEPKLPTPKPEPEPEQAPPVPEPEPAPEASLPPESPSSKP